MESRLASKIARARSRLSGVPSGRMPSVVSMSRASTRPASCSFCRGSKDARRTSLPSRYSKNERRSRLNAGISM